MLNELGLIPTLGPRRDAVRFDAHLAHHHHYVCVRCGLVRDFESAAGVLPLKKNPNDVDRLQCRLLDLGVVVSFPGIGLSPDGMVRARLLLTAMRSAPDLA